MSGSNSPRIGLVTCARYANLHPDDLSLKAALEARGLSVEAVVWDQPPEALPHALVLRTPWDYAQKSSEFLTFIEDQEFRGRSLWNPPQVLRWNLHKRYLLELSDLGLPIVPSVLIPVSYLPKLLEKFESERPGHWPTAGDLVVKPAVGAGGYENQILESNRGRLAPQARPQDFSSAEVLVQPFWPSVSEGERSLVFFAGQFSHAVLKIPTSGEYRTQEQYGADIRPYGPPEREMAFARAVVAAIPGRWLYARVDYLVDPTGAPALMELELVEPCLFLSTDPSAAERLADLMAKLPLKSD